MMAQIYRNLNNASNKLTTDQHYLSLASHCDVNDISFQELNYDKLKSCMLFPKFIINFEIFVQNLVLEKSIPIQTKFRCLSYLLCVKVFFAKNNQEIHEFMKSCFDMSLFVKFCNQSRGNDKCNNEFSPLEIPIFQDRKNHLLKAILVLFQAQ